MATFFAIGVIFLLAGCVQGVTGFGAGLIAIPLLCLIIDIKTAIPLVVLNGLAMTSWLAFSLRRSFDRRKIVPLITGAVPGIFLGGYLLQHINQDIARILLGALLVLYSCIGLLFQPRPRQLPGELGYLAGFCSGCITSLLSAGGPPVIMYSTLMNWKPEEIRATLTAFFVCNAGLTVMVHAAHGMTTVLTLKYFLVTMPLILAGTNTGSLLNKRIGQRLYLRLVYLLLLPMGILMIWG